MAKFVSYEVPIMLCLMKQSDNELCEFLSRSKAKHEIICPKFEYIFYDGVKNIYSDLTNKKVKITIEEI